ncbi:hypothetical protein M514_02807 [Trichuris suis]|uniref:Tc1-like transposase DDE domain-containing protein n=1 Tax=Trichuris suis TaxID=68888 RepID=A0A085MGK6_9BILA|nr:hypothetical protein M513_02807 [Trichuris suis]KFD63770.1 hypothetical protein M514_02807 [Trichuris suis]
MLMFQLSLSRCFYLRELEICETFLENVEKKVLDIDKILRTDEAIFKLNGRVNCHNIVYWSVAHPQQNLEREVNAPGVVVWAEIWSGGVLGLFFFDGNATTDSYLKMIADKVMPCVKDTDLVFMHDEHRLTTRHLCIIISTKTFPIRGLGKGNTRMASEEL